MEEIELISILIPTYNSESRLSNCLESVKKQSYKKLEILICDSGSIDDTINIINNYVKNDNRFRLIVSNVRGRSYQRNLLLDNSRGKYIFMMDSDDTIDTDCISILYSLIKKGFDVVMPQIVLCDDADNKYGVYEGLNKTVKLKITKTNLFSNLIKLNIIGCTKMYKKEIIDRIRYDEKLVFGDDVVFNLIISLNKEYNYCYTVNAHYFYYRPANNKTETKYIKYASCLLDKLIEISKNESDFKIRKSVYELYLYYLEIFLFRHYANRKIPSIKYLKYRFFAINKCKNLTVKKKLFLLFPLLFIIFKFIKKFIHKQLRICQAFF